MSNFTLTGHRPDSYPDLNIFVGTLTLITKLIVLKASNGIAMAYFTLNGDLVGCPDATCSNPEFSLGVNLHGPLTLANKLTGENSR